MGTTRQEGSSCSRWSRRTDGARAAATRTRAERRTRRFVAFQNVRDASCRVCLSTSRRGAMHLKE